MYKDLSVYRCTQKRSFQPSSYIAFYVDKKIQPLVPKVESVIESIHITRDEELASLDSHQKELASELRKNIGDKWHGPLDRQFKIMFLSGPDDDSTVDLKEPIIHDTKGAFVQRHRYVGLESLKKARKTSEL